MLRNRSIVRMRDRTIIALIVAIFMFSVLPVLPRGAVADTGWTGYLPTTLTVVNQTISNSAKDPAGIAEVSCAAHIDYIAPPSIEHPYYYEIGVNASASTNTRGKLGYNAPTYASGILGTPVDCASIGDDEGRWIYFHDVFYFPYYGKWYDRVYVSSNGFASFDQRAVNTTSDTKWTRPSPDMTFPNQADPNSILAPWWRDLGAGYIYSGRSGYGAYWDSFTVYWESPNKGYDGATQMFAVRFECNYNADGATTGTIKFLYQQITKPYHTIHGKKIYMPTGVGMEDQWGMNGQTINAYQKSIANKKIATISPFSYNSNGIVDIQVTAEKMLASTANDPDSSIDVTGTYNEVPGGQNIGSINPALDPYSKEKTPGVYYAVDAGLIGLGYVPVVGQVLDAIGLVRDAAGLLGCFSPAPTSSLHDTDRTAMAAWTRHVGVDEVAGQFSSNRPYDVYTTPTFKWRLWTVDLLGNPIDVRAVDHYLFIHVDVNFGIPGGSTSTLTTEAMYLKIMAGSLMPLWSDDFEDGSISDWSTLVAGTSIVAADNTMWHTGHWSMHVKYGGYSYAQATSPFITNWDTSKDYRITLWYYSGFTKMNIVLDDGRIRLLNEFFLNPATGLSEPYLVAVTSTGEKGVAPLSTGQWHSIELREMPGNFEVLLDGVSKGIYYPVDPFNTKNQITVGSKVPSGSKDLGDAYWDDLILWGNSGIGKRGLWVDGFEDGSISDWVVNVGGTNIVAADSTKAHSGSWSLHISFVGGIYSADATSPTLTNWDTTKEYTVTFSMFLVKPVVTGNAQLMAYYDGRVYIEAYCTLGSSTATLSGIGAGWWRDDICNISTDQWHTVEIRTNPSAGGYAVFVDGIQHGTTHEFFSSASAKNSVTLGYYGGRFVGNCYWDDFVLIGFPKA